MLNYELLRPFNPHVDSAAITSNGTHLDYDVACRLYRAGVPGMKAKPIAWLDGRPVYGDSIVYRHIFKDYVRADHMGAPSLAIENGNVSWIPPFEDADPEAPEESLVEIYIDGERVFCELAPPEAAGALREYCALIS